MSSQPENAFTQDFWHTCAALACVLMATAIMNVAVFPRFDAVFTYARDVSVLANSVTLIAVGLLATFRPSLLPPRVLTRTCTALLAAGAVLLPAGLYAHNAVVLTVAACLLSVGRGWVIVVAGIAASRLSIGQAGLCLVLAFVAQYVAAALVWIVPAVVGAVLFLALPFAALVLIGNRALPVLQETQHGQAPADFSVTQPSTFLPLASQLFVCLFLYRVAFGFSLRFGEVDGTPLPDFLGIVPVAAVALYLVFSRRAFPADLLAQLSALAVVAGFLAVPLGTDASALAGVTLLSVGNSLFDMVAWLVLIAVAGRNLQGAVAAFAWGRGVSGLGSTVGAELGVWSNGILEADPAAVSMVTGVFVLLFVGYTLIGLKSFSFSDTIEGVVPVAAAAAEEPKLTFDRRCAEVASAHGLSPRELEVFMMLARGRDRAYIQEKLVVSRNTVKAHVKHVYAKLDIHTHQELIDLVSNDVEELADHRAG